MAFETKKLPNEEKVDAKPKDTSQKDADKAKKDAKPKRTSKPKRPVGRPDLEAKLNEFIAMAAVTACGINLGDGIIIAARGESLAHAWAELAKVNPNVDRVLRRMVEGGVWAGVVGSTLAVAVPVLQNHSEAAAKVPTPFGMSPKDVDKARASNEMIDAIMKMQEDAAAKQAANGGGASATN